jgi:hypothetical protein
MCEGQTGLWSDPTEVTVIGKLRICEWGVGENHERTIHELDYLSLSVQYNTDLGHVHRLFFF